MSWLSRLTPRGPGSRANRNAAPPSPVTADPETCLMVFQNHWRQSSAEEMIASTAYLDLFLRSVTETALLKTFLRFVLLHRHDNDTILDTLLTRISSNSRLCMVSLSLFRTLLSLNCEDLMLQLILRYLLPCTHVMLSQRRAVRETDIYGKSADKFLSLIPECCRLDTAPSGDQEDDPASGGKVPGSPSVARPAWLSSSGSRAAEVGVLRRWPPLPPGGAPVRIAPRPRTPRGQTRSWDTWSTCGTLAGGSSSAPGAAGTGPPPTTVRTPPQTPQTWSLSPLQGAFMMVLFCQAGSAMLQNSLYVNILLTGIVAQLACYPQPLLRSFLLNTNMVFQPSVKSLIQVLGSVKNRVEALVLNLLTTPRGSGIRKNRVEALLHFRRISRDAEGARGTWWPGKLDRATPLGMAVPNLSA
ncbi:hypothetical protein AAFF_G00015910 [Aldrovandia affinis]|uniref:FHF complex subunit HOOK-interacting protein C-terminal domain-containing protein n=1 Tax=Aldrovandia affinis TaxID=143900 RepID=A0AAD7R2R6_9TELE|nr:hypothetical protein AAFF_G00015910 [Aldrovandia affinis]